MKLLLEKALEHFEAGSARRAAGDFQQARRHFLQAAEFLFQAASKSDGRFREIRLAKAEQLVALARELEAKSASRRPTASKASGAESEPSSFLMRQPAEVGFDDVAGLDEAKEQIRLRVIYPLQYPEKAAHYGIKRGGGLLLYGPPGTGKTMLARAVAGEIDAGFFTAKPSELMSKWVGEAEQNIERLFEEARACERAVIFLDEVEAMIPARRSSGSTVMQRVVPQILAELQGVRSGGGTLLFMGATNEPWAIDSAALRPGRFDAKVYVGLPDLTARRRLLELHLARRPLAADVELDRLAESLDGYSGADVADLCERCAARVFLESLKRGIDRDIAQDDVRAAIQSVRPSVSAKDLEKFDRWAEGR